MSMPEQICALLSREYETFKKAINYFKANFADQDYPVYCGIIENSKAKPNKYILWYVLGNSPADNTSQQNSEGKELFKKYTKNPNDIDQRLIRDNILFGNVKKIWVLRNNGRTLSSPMLVYTDKYTIKETEKTYNEKLKPISEVEKDYESERKRMKA